MSVRRPTIITCDLCPTTHQVDGRYANETLLWRLVRIGSVSGDSGFELHLCPQCMKVLREFLEAKREPSEEL